ncbi:1,5-anhydro-D-fructose reductase-like [Schistocerca gregaria]|uniref:1,5-anhydro-D-fructose reductase-like n=1 Tax=Schistocerca gregaria TaxID=7010 RepID=UPI00211EBC17|nr:1,5-anhydro-D-fructose reductase-like [Schistocerca gregaria]XP_049842378.1 1,5-anhydro-D-fructose reductase-like [Schistocerca gregaria]XP_049842379.1 1,5-anhydro-D-fructose reductase-like [Schistocerca gregaria]
MAPKLEDVTFFNGHKMPIVGLGTGQASKGEVGRAIDVALETGYRHIDAAYLYGNEAEIGQALKKWFDSGKLKREDLFIVTKLPAIANRAESVEKYLKKSLEALQLNYVDLYLIHQPVGFQDVGGDTFPRDKDGKVLLDMNTDIISLWKAMEAQVDAGRARSIGLSNFNSSQIKRIWQAARIRPANLQVELHIYFQQRELAAFCKALDVTVCAFAPLGSPQMPNLFHARGGDASKLVSLSPMSDPVVSRIAEKYKKTTAQVLLRHTVQRGIVVIPKSVNPDRIKQNFDIFDFELTQEDMDELDALDKGPKGRMFNDAIAPERTKHPEYPFHERY